ncbi:hybrid sensor histidine kinase/response regulator [Pseudomonas citronellolis]|uniref:hybrid sensor histidine kinase/response regulator n=1 Tax=Pseudomonas citronellolis TaxID=53408 RepID=UPI0023E37461|nr:hybrid sensor histidine kinase/response regulator [Pseudomonas citronellolis]MDF3936386.1 ATP-binding protein [Pseudomonas citronellolis]
MNDDGSIRRLLRSSQRLNLWLCWLLVLSLALVGFSYWALQRLLDEERRKVEFHFVRLLGDLREHEDFLRHVDGLGDAGVERDEAPRAERGLPFSLIGAAGAASPETARRIDLGWRLARLYTRFWGPSAYPPAQVLLLDPQGEKGIAVPAVDGLLGDVGLRQASLPAALAQIAERLRERPPRGDRVHWARAGGYLGARLALLGYREVALPMAQWGAERLVAVSLLDPKRIDDYQQTLGRPLFDRLTLLGPDGRRLLGPPASAVGAGLSLGPGGLRVRLRSAAERGWVAVYDIGYPLVLRDLQWLPLLLPTALLGGLAGAWLGRRRYARRVVAPARRAHLRVIESDAFSRTLFQVAPVAMCVLAGGGRRVILHNRLATRWLGVEAQIVELLGGWRLFDGGPPGEICTEVGGRYLQAAFASTRYCGEEGLLCVFKDVSAHREAQQALLAAKRAADSASAAKTLFLASMSHEIRTPLYAVLGTLELLGLAQLGEQQRDYLRTAQGAAGTLLQLISDILDVSRIEAGQLALAPVDFDPLALAGEAMRGFAGAAAARHLQFYACLDAELPRSLHGDPLRLRQVLDNLLSNALKFTDSGRVALRLTVLERRPGRVRLQWQVSDTGIGIAEADQAHLFEAFYQVEGERHRGAGTGLGLSICRRLAQLMGGELQLVSAPGLGSSFSLVVELPTGATDAAPEVCLPGRPVYLRCPVAELAQNLEAWLRAWGVLALNGEPAAGGEPGAVLLEVLAEPLPASAWSGARVRVEAGAGGPPVRADDGAWQASLFDPDGLAHALALAQGGAVRMPAAPAEAALTGLGLHVLVAEDNPLNRALLREQLEELGCRVSLAADGAEALRQFEVGSFDVLLTDLNMPRLDGCALSRELRRRGVGLPILGVTASAMREDGERCRAAGMDGWLVKPLDLRSLHDALRSLRRDHGAAPAPPATGGLEVPARLRGLFRRTLGHDLRRAADAVRRADAEALGQALHRLAGALAVVQGHALARACRGLEVGLGEGRVEPRDARVPRLLRRIAAALRAV